MGVDDRTRALTLFWHDGARPDTGPAGTIAWIGLERTGGGLHDRAWALVLGGSIMDAGFTPRSTGSTKRLVMRTAPGAGSDRGQSDDRVDLEDAARSLAQWSPSGRSAFDGVCDRVAVMAIDAGVTVCLRPHAAHMLSDIPSCLGFLRRWSGGPFELLIDALDLITPGMMARAEDHVARIADALAGTSGTAAVLARSPAERLAPDLLLPLVRRAREVGTPVVVAGRVSPGIEAALGPA